MAKTNLFRTADNFETYPAGHLVFEEGQPGAVMYIVKEGEVEVLVGDSVVETLDAGDIFGEMALVEKQDRSATARAKTKVQVVPVSEDQFAFLLQQTPYFAVQVMHTMAGRLRRMNERSH